MNRLMAVSVRELKIGFRNPWTYSFMALFTLFMFSLLLIQSQGYVTGYSGATSTLINLTLYLLPLMTLMLGSFSLTGEKEDGNWALLSVYPLGTGTFLAGKYVGLAIVILLITAFGFGIAGLVGWVYGRNFDFSAYMILLAFAVSLSLLYLAVSMIAGAVARNRWQALSVSAAIWFMTVIAWTPVLIAVLGLMPYPWIKPAVTALTFLNPAELTRLYTVIKLGGGSILGPEYYEWIVWIQRPSGSWAFLLVAAAWIVAAFTAACAIWERGRRRG